MLLMNLFQAAGMSFSLSLVCLLIPAMGALRLAKFNVDPEQSTTFTGLPIPACALFCIGLAAILAETPTGVNVYAAVGSVIGIALLMVVPVRMYSLKFKSLKLKGNILRFLLVIVAIICLGLFGWQGLFWLTGYYVVSAFIAGIFTTEV